MSSRNEFSVGCAAKLVGAIADQGGTPEEANTLAENPMMVREILAVIRGLGKVVVVNILQLIKQRVKIPALIGTFPVEKYFVCDVSEKAIVKISYLGDNFKKWFLCQTVSVREAVCLDVWKLTKNSLDNLILTELGLGKGETTLDIVFVMMKNQPKGEEGILLTNGRANIFYIKDVSDVLRAVSVVWLCNGWYVCATPVESPYESHKDGLVFSRNSLSR
jgi:hypothetical protein